MSEENAGGVAKKFLYVNRKAPYGTIYGLESLEVVLIGAAFGSLLHSPSLNRQKPPGARPRCRSR